MAEPEDPSSARLEVALTETQRLEREELHAALERQRTADERVVEALSTRRDDG